MIHIQFANFNFRFKQKNNIEYIFDDIRKNWFVITPEEWVRQNFIKHLTTCLQYPASLIAVEKEVKVGEQKKRFDIVVYKENIPWMIVECKQTNVEINDKVLQQILAYNTTLQAKYIVVTNGNNTICWQINSGSTAMCAMLPAW